MTEAEINNLFAQVAAGDPTAAPQLRALAARLNTLADRLEAGTHPFTAPSGMSDRVRVQVQGPDGRIVRETDTNPPRS